MVSRIPKTFHFQRLITFTGLLYNLFADAQLGLGLVPDSVYQMQSSFYPTVANKYGVPLDTRHTYTKGEYSDIPTLDCFANCESGDWQCFAAAVASTDTRSTFLKDLATWVNETPTNRALTDLYDTVTGKYVLSNQSTDIRMITQNCPSYPRNTFVARPVMGGSFAPLLVTR